MTLIPKNHFALNRTDYMKGLIEGRYKNEWPEHLNLHPVKATENNLSRLQGEISEKWHWNAQGRYNDGSLPEKLKHPETALIELMDDTVSLVEPIGYTFVTAPDVSVKERFWNASTHPVIEIENLGLFPDHEGGGRGKAYFEMLFAQYFNKYETVYWSQHETHSPTLKSFYMEKMGMTLLDVDYVPDFRPRELKFG
jgi:hypothetical protein